MLHDLADADGPVTLVADVAVVGAGIAGLVLATRLARAGLSTVVVESGGRGGDEAHPLNAVESDGAPYRGAELGRRRGLGGTSTRWGGALLPFLPEDLGPRPELGVPAWPVGYDELAPWLAQAEALFGLAPGPYEARPLGDAGDGCDFLPREAKWPTFRRRNVATLLSADVASPALAVWLNATVTGLRIDRSAGRIAGLEARHVGGEALTVHAPDTVLCAGAIETTRLLLYLERQSEGRLASPHLGRALQDHVSLPLAHVVTPCPSALNRLAGFRFDRGTMRSLRFELSPQARSRDGVAGGFVHIAPRALQPTGFDAVRDLLRSLQQGRPDAGAALRTLRDVPYLARLATWRYGRRRLCWPRPAAYDVHLVAEQTPSTHNAITLSRQLDALGVPRAHVAWAVREADARTFRAMASAFDAYWATALGAYGRLAWPVAPRALTLEHLGGADDIFHPVGTTRMATSATGGVVDGSLAVWGVDGLSVAATSAFPCGGTANPTMTLVGMTLRLADRLARQHRWSSVAA
ncbi:GMC oxidoreductase [Acuticoccus sp.]|uniref:GMC oxidoreductase n=1 Tax=Acuticoccus sp. TaxID=1904378 RepID=UPI003B529BA4